MAVTLASRLGATSRIFRPGSHSYGKGTLFVLPADVAKLQVRFARAIQFAGTSLRRFYKRQLQKDIRATTERRSGRLRRPVTVKRYGRRSLGEIELVESFPHTSFGGGAGPAALRPRKPLRAICLCRIVAEAVSRIARRQSQIHFPCQGRHERRDKQAYSASFRGRGHGDITSRGGQSA